VHRGRDAVVGDMLGSAMGATAGTFRVRLEDVIAHGPFLAAAFVSWSATRGGEEMSGQEIGVYRVRDGHVVEASFQLDDPEATDAFFAAT
jgi:ketosteroid isomerase-like protein